MNKGPSVDYNKMSSNKNKPNNRANFDKNNYRNSENKRSQYSEPVKDDIVENSVVAQIEPAKVEEPTKDNLIRVRVETPTLNIRKGPGMDRERTGNFTGKGIFTIVDIKSGNGSKSGWGKLESGDGWISLDYTTRV